MNNQLVRYSKGQLKIQQMAFVLVMIFIFFSMVGLVYFSFSMHNREKRAQELFDKEALELVQKFAGSPEFSFTSRGDCNQCVDFDKVLQLKKLMLSGDYKNFIELNYLALEKVYPSTTSGKKECEASGSNWNDCNYITLIDKGEYAAKAAIVTVVSYDPNLEPGNFRYSLGRIHASGDLL